MPQINQLSEIFFSQLFWLLLVFGIIYFGIARGMVPKIQSTVELREKKIADDLAAAQQARESAEETEAAYRAKIDVSRAEAAAVTQEARQSSARETETKVRAAAEKIAAKVPVPKRNSARRRLPGPKSRKWRSRRPGNGRAAVWNDNRPRRCGRGGEGGNAC